MGIHLLLPQICVFSDFHFIMTPVFFFVLFLSLAVVPPGATEEEDVEVDLEEIIEKENAEISGRLIHGDLMPNRDRNAVPCTSKGCKWPKRGRYVRVPVAISSSYSRSERSQIINTLLTFHKTTCIRFYWRRWYHRNYLYFYSGSGCWSYLGRQSRGQLVSLKKRGCMRTKTIQHEVLHALGFHHEHSRSDRDTYVTILTQNIISGQESNFRKVDTNNLGTPYDFNSVMQYSKYGFSKNGQPTILAKSDPNLNFGLATKMSVNDIARVNKLYRC